MDAFHNDEFMLPDEEKEYINGVPVASENEQKVLREWWESWSASSAYIMRNGEMTVIYEQET